MTFEDILNESKEPIKSHLEDLLFFIENEGFIYSHQICKDEFSVPETVYSWGMQPAFDYLIGRKIYDVIKTGNNIDIEYTNGIYQMLSLIAIEEDEKLISEYSNIKLEESRDFALKNKNPCSACEFQAKQGISIWGIKLLFFSV